MDTQDRARITAPGILALMAVAEFMLTLDLSIVNVALPAMRADLGFTQTSLQWVVNGYALAFGGVLLLGGRMADVFGGRRVFLVAISAFTVTSLVCGLATGQALLIAARFVQGLSAGILAPATLSMLTGTYDKPAERNRALAIWTAVAIGGGSVGTLAGGVLTDALSWRWIFIINVPIGASLVGLAAAHLPRSASRQTTRAQLDVAGAVTVTAGMATLVWALMHADTAGWDSGPVIGGLATAGVLLLAFGLVETRLARDPLVSFGLFRSRLLSAGNLLSFLSFTPVMATWFFLTLYLQRVRDYHPLEAGLVFLPLSLAVIAGSQLSFRLLSRIDARALFAGGGALAAAGMTGLALLTTDTGIGSVIAVACLAMAGGGLMFAPITVAATSALPPGLGGLASGLLNTTRQLGGAVGLAMLGTVAATHTAHAGGAELTATTAGYTAAFAAGAALYLLTAVTGALTLPARLGISTELGRPALRNTRTPRGTRDR